MTSVERERRVEGPNDVPAFEQEAQGRISTPIHDRLAAHHAVAVAEPVKPRQTLLLGLFMVWCPVCESVDFMHEHPEDPRAASIGDVAFPPTVSEAAWINAHGLPNTHGYLGPFRPEDHGVTS